MEDIQRRARKITIRLASMANRSFWLSASEVFLHIITDGDCLQTHKNIRIFTRQLQFSVQQCKRYLNKEAIEEPPEEAHRSVQAVSFQLTQHVDDAEEKDEEEDRASESDVNFDKLESCETRTNTSDDYAHRGRKLWSMPYYVYRMYVNRIRGSPGKAKAPNIFPFEQHYGLFNTYVQQVVFNVHVPTIDGFQCPTVERDAEQNALLKSLLFTPWVCTDPLNCGSVRNFGHFLSNGSNPTDGDDPQPAASSSSSSAACGLHRAYTLQRAWRLRRSELHVLADRAEARRAAARKWLVIADTTIFAEQKEPLTEIAAGEERKSLLSEFCCQHLRRTMPAQGMRLILAHLGLPSKWHDEQCTLAEFCAYVGRDVLAHIDLAAEARVKKLKQTNQDADSDCEDSSSDEGEPRAKTVLELVDVGGGDDGNEADAGEGEVPSSDISNFPVNDIARALSLCFQQDDVAALSSKSRKSQADLDLKDIDDTYGPLWRQSSTLKPTLPPLEVRGYGSKHRDMIAMQKAHIALVKKQMSCNDADGFAIDDNGDAYLPSTASLDAEPELVPMPLAMLGPAAVARKLLADAKATEEQIDAVALMALSLQKRFDARPDKSSIRLPVATLEHNHRAVWLGGGGVGKTRTLSMVVQPLAETFFGPDGYMATAQSNQAARNLGSRGRTLHAANGLLMTDSLQTARLRLNPQTQKKLDRLVANLGVDVIDELGAVPGDMLHADALRKTYGRCYCHNLDTTRYMKPSETWGRMAVKILSGDFYQLPPVPASASLLAKPTKQSYEHQQGRKLLTDMEYVIEFVKMQRFEDPLLVEVLEAMRTPGGKSISEAAWQALKGTAIEHGAATGSDPRLTSARLWYECAYEWRIVSYAMHAHAILNARAAGKLLFYIPAIDVPSGRLSRPDYDEMRAHPNISTTAKLPGILSLFVGMEMIITESYLPPHIVRGTPVTVVDIELHPQEPPLAGRSSIVEHGSVLLRYMPKCIYVRVEGCNDIFLASSAGAAQPGIASSSQPGVNNLRGIIAVQPISKPWKFKGKGMDNAVSVSRTQCPLLPQKQCTLHGVQGKTADPGIIVHWKFPKGLGKESIWLAYYVSLSRPRSFSRLLSHGLPDRDIIEGGPPESINEAFDALFTEKIKATKVACAEARAEMGWHPRLD